tara:strand:+ start:943 stop:1692 length:750 start_codon:yes stop_codon:yes gene_type:complete
MKWYIGTSGFMISKKNWLELKDLNCIEINSSFYSLPSIKTINNWYKTENIVYSLKCSKLITHIKRLHDCKKEWNIYWNRVSLLKEKLVAILIQLPPSFKLNDDTFKRLKIFLSYLPLNKVDIVFEFRDKSWFIESIYKLFKRYKVTIGGSLISRPTKKYWLGNLPSGINIPERTSNTTYIRVHGEKGYKGFYKKSVLKTLKNKIKKKKTKKNYVMFNNTFFVKRNKSCKKNNKQIKYAAVCDAIDFANL